jgi:hypothetical protein
VCNHVCLTQQHVLSNKTGQAGQAGQKLAGLERCVPAKSIPLASLAELHSAVWGYLYLSFLVWHPGAPPARWLVPSGYLDFFYRPTQPDTKP